MSTGLPTVQNLEFDAQTKAAYQTSGTLRRRCRVKTGIVGKSVDFRRANRGMATRRTPQTNVIPMGQGYGVATATLTDWSAAEYTDVFDQAKTSVEERGIVAGNIAGAIGRREDQLLLDALDAANASANIAVAESGSNTGLTFTKLLAMFELMNRRAVPRDKRVLVIGARQERELLGIPQFTSGDYVTKMAVQDGNLPPLLGFQLAVIEDRDEGGLVLSGGIRTCFAYDQDALGLAIGIDFRTEVNYIAEKTSWLANGLFSAGATVIDPAGVIEVACAEA